jgi:choline-sulfatase
MDEQIGRILDALEKSGKADNTYVILTADHGLAVGEHGLMGKQNMYDCSLRMPLLISGPGIKAGSRVDELVYQHCLYATTCELAGVPVPSTVGFKSIAPLLHGDKTPVYDAVFSYYRDFQRMVRTKTHKLIVYPQVKKMQVFDLEKDPWEMHDVSDDPAYADVKADLMRRLKQLQAELEDPLDLDHPKFQKDLTLAAPGSTA